VFLRCRSTMWGIYGRCRWHSPLSCLFSFVSIDRRGSAASRVLPNSSLVHFLSLCVCVYVCVSGQAEVFAQSSAAQHTSKRGTDVHANARTHMRLNSFPARRIPPAEGEVLRIGWMLRGVPEE
jgi:hypothetical protein